jgi:hypothetical protein
MKSFLGWRSEDEDEKEVGMNDSVGKSVNHMRIKKMMCLINWHVTTKEKKKEKRS